MDWSVIKDSLLDNKKVGNITLDSNSVFKDCSYLYVIHCSLSVNQTWIPVVICVPEDWRTELVHIFIENYSNFPFIPHCETNGKLCLYELEGALIDWNLCGVLNNCIMRAVSVIEDGLMGRNQIDLLNEFNSYWGQLNKTRLAYFDVPADKKTTCIRYAIITRSKNKNEKNIEYQYQMSRAPIYASTDETFFSFRKVTQSQRKGLYIYYESAENLLPPDPREGLSLNYINRVLSNVSLKTWKKVLEKQWPTCCLLFEVKNACSVTVLWGVLIENGEFKELSKNHFELSCAKNIYPLEIIRLDKQFLMSRTSDNENLMQSKKYLLIGCGSIGGYVAQELAKSGCEDITLVDDDILKEENIFRHVLGTQYTFTNKAVALKRPLEQNIPNLNIKVRERRIEDALEDGSLDLNEYDIIISAVGNHNVNRVLNKYIYEHSIQTPTIYLWNEPLDVGCHAMRVKYGDRGCFECLFRRDNESSELYDSYSYCERGQEFTQNTLGCNNTFIPYGSTVSLKVTSIGMDLIRKEIEGRCAENVLVSFKGEGYHFRRAGLFCSEIYDSQENTIDSVRGSCFCNEYCNICR